MTKNWPPGTFSYKNYSCFPQLHGEVFPKKPGTSPPLDLVPFADLFPVGSPEMEGAFKSLFTWRGVPSIPVDVSEMWAIYHRFSCRRKT